MTLHRSRPTGREFSLVELLIATSVLVIGIFGVLGALTAQAQTRMFSNENEFAAHHLQQILSEYHTMSTTALVADIYARPDRTAEYADVREVVSVTVKILSELRASELFPADLDGDGIIEVEEGGDDCYDLDRDGIAGEQVEFDVTSNAAEQEHSGYQIVPLEVVMVWRDSSGKERTREIRTIVYDLEMQ